MKDDLYAPTRLRALEHAEKIAARIFDEAARSYREKLEENLNEWLPGNHSAGDVVALATAMTLHDGYNAVEFHEHEQWEKRAQEGWHIAATWLADVPAGRVVTLLFEARYGEFTRSLAVDLEQVDPGERTPAKAQFEAGLRAHGIRYMLLTETETLSRPDLFRRRLESATMELTDRVLMDAGVIAEREPFRYREEWEPPDIPLIDPEQP